MLALVDAAARRLLGRGSNGAFDCLSWGRKDRLEVAEEDDLSRGGVGAVVCDCGDPVALVLGDVADDDARGSPEVYHSVATINAPESLDELCADISVSEHARWRRRQIATFLWRSIKAGNTRKDRRLVWSPCVALNRYGMKEGAMEVTTVGAKASWTCL